MNQKRFLILQKRVRKGIASKEEKLVFNIFDKLFKKFYNGKSSDDLALIVSQVHLVGSIWKPL